MKVENIYTSELPAPDNLMKGEMSPVLALFYCHHAMDNMAKRCTREQFYSLVDSPRTEELIRNYRNGTPADQSKAKLPLIYFHGALDEEKYEEYMRTHKRLCEMAQEKGEKKPARRGSRNQIFFKPLALLMLDWDHEKEPVALWEKLRQRLEEQELLSHLMFAHITPSGEGLRLVMERLPGMQDMSIQKAQAEWCRILQAPQQTLDQKCKDIARGSFIPQRKDILFLDDRLFEPPLLENAGKEACGKQETAQATAPAPLLAAETAREEGKASKPQCAFPTDYHGIPYAIIVQRLQKALGGEPKRGERNSFLLKMAQHMAYLCNKDPYWVASVLPRYGQEENEFMSTVLSGCGYTYNAGYHKRIMTLVDSLQGVCGLEELPPKMPSTKSLPPFIQAVIKGSPEEVQPGVALTSFAAMDCYLHKAVMIDASERPTEPAFQVLLVAPSGSGKSSIDHTINCIMAEIKETDEQYRQKEKEWKEAVRRTPKNTEPPQRPKCPQQFLTPDITSAALFRIMEDNNGRPALIFTTELDSLRKMSDGADPHERLRKMEDHVEDGKHREGYDFESVRVKLYANIVASSTVKQAQDFFGNRNNAGKGNISRLLCCIIAKDGDNWNAEIPVYKNQTEEFQESLIPFIQSMKQASYNTYNVAEAKRWAKKLQKRLAKRAEAYQDRVYSDFLLPRAVKNGFWRAMMLYLMEGGKWTKEIEQFATWSVEYDLWCKMKIFGPALRRELESESIIPRTKGGSALFLQLPDQFCKDHLVELYKRMGKLKVQATNLLVQWQKRGKIVFVESEQVYRKVL